MKNARPLRYDLGGVGRGGPRITVNIHDDADIREDVLKLDSFCDDGTVEEFYLCHALEHIPSQHFRKFLSDMLRKLRPGGMVRVVQTDIKRSLDMYHRGELSFRAVRSVIFPPADRLRRNPYNQHFNMWGAEELAEDFRAVGFAHTEYFDAGTWRMDNIDELHPGELEKFHQVQIPNLGVAAMKARTAVEPDVMNLPASEPEIPRIIHQTWKETSVPPLFDPAWMASWRELNPDWEYRLWTDADIAEFVRKEYPEFWPFFAAYDVPIKRVDAFRYLLLRKVGGVYVDLDFMCLKPLDSLLTGQFLLFGCQHPGDWAQSDRSVCNAFMASVPGHPFWDGITVDLIRNAHKDVLNATGPDFLTDRVKRCVAFLEAPLLPGIADHSLLYPFTWDDEARLAARTLSREDLASKYPVAFAITFWTASWKNPVTSCM